MQGLYAYFQAEDQDIKKAEKDLIASFQNIELLYFWLLSFLHEIRQQAIKTIEDAKNKKLPTKADLNPNTRFIENRFLKSIEENKTLLNVFDRKKIQWTNDLDLVHKIFLDIKNSEVYRSYMNESESGLLFDKKFICRLIEEIISEHELILHFFEDKNVHWTDDLFVAISGLFKTVDSFDGKTLELPALYKNENEDIQFSLQLFEKCIRNEVMLQEMISDKTVNWEVERIAQMDILLMKMALTEILFFENIPVKVALNEYIDISKEYSTPKSKIFINGVLDKIVLELKTNNKILKSGRGLKEN
jgi:transcription antitermination protein NusB